MQQQQCQLQRCLHRQVVVVVVHRVAVAGELLMGEVEHSP